MKEANFILRHPKHGVAFLLSNSRWTSIAGNCKPNQQKDDG